VRQAVTSGSTAPTHTVLRAIRFAQAGAASMERANRAVLCARSGAAFAGNNFLIDKIGLGKF
jgi:hypothetical protein